MKMTHIEIINKIESKLNALSKYAHKEGYKIFGQVILSKDSEKVHIYTIE